MTTALTTTESNDVELTKTKQARILIDRFSNDVIMEGRVPTLSVLPTKEERAVLSDRRASLAGQLRPVNYSVANKEKFVAVISRFFGNWPTFKPEKPKEVVATYLMALGDFPLWAIESVCSDIAKGGVTGVNPAFPTAAPQMAQLCGHKIAVLQAEHVKVSGLLAVRDVRVSPLTPEEREISVAKHKEWEAQRDSVDEEIDTKRRDELAARSIARNEQAIRDEYKARGEKPVTAGKFLVSPSLLKNIQEEQSRKARIPKTRQD